MTKEEIIEYLYENNVRGDLTIEQMAEEIADTPQTKMDKCYKCKWWNYSYGCSNKKGICDFEPTADTPQTDCSTCKWGEWYRNGRDVTTMDDECGGCCSWNSKWTPKEPQTDCGWGEPK